MNIPTIDDWKSALNWKQTEKSGGWRGRNVSSGIKTGAEPKLFFQYYFHSPY